MSFQKFSFGHSGSGSCTWSQTFREGFESSPATAPTEDLSKYVDGYVMDWNNMIRVKKQIYTTSGRIDEIRRWRTANLGHRDNRSHYINVWYRDTKVKGSSLIIHPYSFVIIDDDKRSGGGSITLDRDVTNEIPSKFAIEKISLHKISKLPESCNFVCQQS